MCEQQWIHGILCRWAQSAEESVYIRTWNSLPVGGHEPAICVPGKLAGEPSGAAALDLCISGADMACRTTRREHFPLAPKMARVSGILPCTLLELDQYHTFGFKSGFPSLFHLKVENGHRPWKYGVKTILTVWVFNQLVYESQRH